MRSKFKWIFTLLVALTVQFSFAQEKTVTGVVSDDLGPITGANVVIQGTTAGTTTDFDGKYAIKAKQGDVLEISFVGMKELVTVGSASVYDVTLQRVMLEGSEVTGVLGIKRKVDEVASTFTVVSAEEMNTASNPNAVRSLAAKVQGVKIDNASNGVNGNTTIEIRGPKTFSGSNAALVVIDGIPSTTTVLASLSPTMIESVNVMQGAQGAALYGELGVNGVIVVTTKKGSDSKKVAININSSVDFEEISFVPEKQLSYGQGWDGVWDQYENGGWGPAFDGSIRNIGLLQADGTYIQGAYSPIKDNIKQFYKTGISTQNGFDISVGGDGAYAMLSANHLNRDFIVKGDGFKRNNILFRGGVSGDKWSVDGTFNYINSRTKQAQAGANVLRGLLQAASNVPIGQFDNGNALGGWNAYYQNPFWTRDNNRITNNSDFINVGATLGYKINDNISLRYNGGIRFSTDGQIRTQGAETETTSEISSLGADLTQVSSFHQSIYRSRTYYGDVMAQFNYQLTDDIEFKGILGQNMRMHNYSRISQGGLNLEIPGWYNIQNVLNPDTPNNLRNYEVENRTTSEFASADFGYKDYLFLNLTGRYDHTSKLLPNNRSYFYPSAGLSFVATKLPSFNVSKIDYLKVYANFTKVGSTQAIADYDVINYATTGTPYANTGSSFNDRYTSVDPNIKPEFYTTYEAGFNLEMFKKRVRLNAAFYMTDTTNAISDLSSSAATSVQTTLSNIGNVKTKGLDFTLGLTPVKTENFKWNTNINFTTYTNEVTDLKGQNEVSLYDTGIGTIVAAVGETFPLIKGTDFVKDAQGRVIVDSNGMPSVDNRQKVLGKVNPDYIVGLTNTLEYKGVSFNVTMDYRHGGNVISGTKYEMTWTGHIVESAEYDRDTGFIYPNSVLANGTPNTTVYTAAGHNTNYGNRAYWTLASTTGAHNVIDATALKVREMSLGYSFPKTILEKLKLTSLKVSVNARNPFIVLADGNRGYTDPEASSVYDSSTSNAGRRSSGNYTSAAKGYSQIGQYPSTRTFGFALNVGF